MNVGRGSNNLMEKVARTQQCSLMSIIRVTKPRGRKRFSMHRIDEGRVNFILAQAIRPRGGVEL